MRNPFEGKTIVGLTGNIATGKSTVMALAAARGALTIDADKVVHQLLADDAAVKAAVRATFSDAVFDEKGQIMRKRLGRVVFQDREQLEKLENILHPAVRRSIVGQLEATTATICIVEAIKLLEGALKALCTQIWVTHCSQFTQVERLKKYRGMTKEDAQMRVMAQGSAEAKIAQADVVIDTNGEQSATQAQFAQAWRNLS